MTYRGVSDFSSRHLVTCLQCLIGDVTEPPVDVVALSSNGFGLHRIFARCYCNHLVAAMSHRGRHTSPLLLRATTAMAIRMISPGTVASKGSHASDTK
jgi:hypothetical protein